MEERIKLSESSLDGTEKEFIQAALNMNLVMGNDSNIVGFENDIQKFLNSGFVTAVKSNTDSLHLSLILSGTEEGDEVICQSLAPMYIIDPILYQRAIPVFVDSERETWNIDPNLLEAAITSRLKKGKKPKAIIAFHLYGMPYKHNEIQEIADYYKIPVIEESSDALGSKYEGKKCGSLGNYSVLSFESGKIITTLGGGALVSRTEENKRKAEYIASLTDSGLDASYDEIRDIGFDYRMSEVVAGIGRAQMEVIEERIATRRSNFEIYRSKLNGIKSIQFLDEPNGVYSNRWLSCILTDTNEIREQIRHSLINDNIECCPVKTPNHLLPFFKDYPVFENRTGEDISSRGLCLPSGSELTQKNLNRIIENIKF